MDEHPDCCFDEWVGHWERRSRRHPTVAGVTAPLVDALEDAGLGGRTVLDIGCGIGDLAIEVVRRGAARASGIELSPRAVEEATRLADRRGVAERTAFTVGDGATTPLPGADVVVLNRVICCYPDIDRLLARSLASARAVYGFTAPPSRGLVGAFAKLQARMSNVWYRLRDRKFHGFRVFVHDLDAVDATIRAAGFRPIRSERRRVVWHLAVYARP